MIEIRNYKQYNSDLLCDYLKNIPWDILELEQIPNEAWLSFKDLFLTAADKDAGIVTRHVCGRSVPWLLPEIKDLMHKRDYEYKKAISTILSYAGVITNDCSMLSTPKCVKRNLIIILASSQVTRTLRKCGRL